MYERCFKRIIDMILSVLGLPVFGLIYIVVAPMIILDDGLPVFYNALRIGKNGKLFKMYKFRTMKKNAPDIRLADGSTYNGVDDPRVTRVGRFLRSTSIDEIPQHVERGDEPHWTTAGSPGLVGSISTRSQDIFTGTSRLNWI